MSLRFEQFELARRRRFCEEAAARLGLPAPSIEKDYWVCWTLRILFGLPREGQYLTFKGGTSLAKAWQVIERFSEDIDIVIDRAVLGCSGDADPAAASISKKERGKRLDRLQAAAGVFTADVLLPAIRLAVAEEIFGHDAWRVELDPAAQDGQTILLEYPSGFARDYVSNVVKVELGARSDTEPKARAGIHSYLAKVLPAHVVEPPIQVCTVRPERTFWEKVMLIHEEGFRSDAAALKGRMSRHLYDVVRLAERGFLARALQDDGLFDRVASHRRIFFARNRDAHQSLRRGELRLVPSGPRERSWREDYRRMQDSMFWRPPPPFDELLHALGLIESEVNASG